MNILEQLRDQIVSNGFVYDSWQSVIGTVKLRKMFVEQIARLGRGVRILDVGCGPGTLYPYIQPLDVKYVGFDINPQYIERAKGRFHDTSAIFIQGDAGASPMDVLMEHGPFDVVLAAAILHHLSDNQAHGLLESIPSLMAPNGIFASYDNALTDPQDPIARKLILADRGNYVREPEGYVKLMRNHFQNVETSIHTDLLRIPYTIFFMRCSNAPATGAPASKDR